MGVIARGGLLPPRSSPPRPFHSDKMTTETHDLLRDLATLREAIKREWGALDPLALTDKEKAALRLNIALCMDELVALRKRMNEDENANRTYQLANEARPGTFEQTTCHVLGSRF